MLGRFEVPGGLVVSMATAKTEKPSQKMQLLLKVLHSVHRCLGISLFLNLPKKLSNNLGLHEKNLVRKTRHGRECNLKPSLLYKYPTPYF